MTVTVRRACLEDRAAIAEFLRESYGELAQYKTGRRWDWQFVDNPWRTGMDGSVPVWIALDQQKVVGQIAVQLAEVKLGSAVHHGGWIVDVMVLPAYRGIGLGHRLHDAVAQDISLLLTLTMAPATRRMAERGGAVTLRDTWQFSRWMRLRPDDVRRYLHQRFAYRPRLQRTAQFLCGWFMFHIPCAWLGNLYAATRPGFACQHATGPVIREIARFGPEIDAFWQMSGSHFSALCVRDSRYLNWRFVDCPDLRYHRFLAMDGETVSGYCVLRRTEPVELRQGIITEIVAAPGDEATLRKLLLHSLAYFGRDVASIECVTSLPEVASLLRSLGFFRTRSTAATCVATDEDVRAEVERRRDEWLFMKGDHDWDQIHLA